MLKTACPLQSQAAGRLYLEQALDGPGLDRARSLRGRQEVCVVLQGWQQVGARHVLRRSRHHAVQDQQRIRPGAVALPSSSPLTLTGCWDKQLW